MDPYDDHILSMLVCSMQGKILYFSTYIIIYNVSFVLLGCLFYFRVQLITFTPFAKSKTPSMRPDI